MFDDGGDRGGSAADGNKACIIDSKSPGYAFRRARNSTRRHRLAKLSSQRHLSQKSDQLNKGIKMPEDSAAVSSVLGFPTWTRQL